jgi:hypothetical protein
MLAKLDFCQNGYGNPKCVHPEEHENYIDFEYVNVNHLQINFCSRSEKCQHIGINNKSHKSLLCGDIFVYDKYLSISSRVYCEKSKIFNAIDFKYQNELERKAFIFAESFFEKIKICGNQNLQTYFSCIRLHMKLLTARLNHTMNYNQKDNSRLIFTLTNHT